MNAQKNIYDLLNDNSSKVYKEYNREADILNSQISKDNVNNVAVVAKYGAGKSSAINTYIKKYRSEKLSKDSATNKLGEPQKNRYVRISLSTFNDADYDEQAIERSILQQLLYSRNKKELPNSKIERTNKVSWKSTFFIIALIAILGTFSLFTGLGFAKSDEPPTLEILSLGWLKYFYLVISIVSFFVLFSYLLHCRFLKRFKYKDLEADFVSNKDQNPHYTNLINKFIDEVLYFFECINVDLVIFEDLDRLPTTEIFAKLRELNLIINNSGKKSKKVTFLYAVKDDLFKTEEERAKFFDFILPIIPVINPNTTKIKIEEKLEIIKEYNSQMQLSGKLIRGVSVFIPDMRILNNTFNDYILMFDKILNDENCPNYLNNDKMFALCLYKNLFPYDYALLEKNEGLIPSILNIQNLHDKCVIDINNEIQEYQNKIQELENLKIESFKQLHGLFLLKLGELSYNSYKSGKINPWTLKSFKDLNQTNLSHPKYPNYSIEFPGGAEIVGPNGERFEDLEQKIIDKNNGLLEKYREKLNILEKRKQEVLQWNVDNIFEEKNVDFFFYKDWDEEYKKKYKIESNNNMNQSNTTFEHQTRYLRFLISQGFIDEHYIEYTSNYKSKILSPADTLVIQKIVASQTTFDEVITDIKEVLRLLEDKEFTKEHIIIKSFLDNLNIIKEEKDNKFENLIQLLKKIDKEKVRENLIKYINISEEEKCNHLIIELLQGDLDVGVNLINEKDILLERKNLILVNLIKTNSNYESLKNNNIIFNFLSYHEKYLQVLEEVENNHKVCEFLKVIQPKFFRLSSKENNDIQKYIIENNMFEINLSNLELILLDDSNQERFYSSNYSFILSSNLKDYILSNLNIYIGKILLIDEITCENEDQRNMEDLLKNEEIIIDLRKSLLKKLNIKIQNIQEFSQDLYQGILENSLIVSSWFNLEYMYERIGFLQIKNYFQNVEEISGDFVKLENILPETPKNIINELLNEMNSKALIKVLNHLPATCQLQFLSFDKIIDENLALFIRTKHITFATNDLEKISNFPKSLNEYLRVFRQEVVDNFDQFFDIALPKMETQRVYENYNYINKTTYSAKQSSQKVIMKVLQCKGIDVTIKNILIDKCQKIINIRDYEEIMANYIIESNQSVPANILWQFSDSTKVSPNDRKKILKICIDEIDLDKGRKQVDSYLQNLGKDYNEFIVNDTPLNVEPNTIDNELFDILKEKKIFNKRKSKNAFVIKK